MLWLKFQTPTAIQASVRVRPMDDRIRNKVAKCMQRLAGQVLCKSELSQKRQELVQAI